jgi:hypothetical protein
MNTRVSRVEETPCARRHTFRRYMIVDPVLLPLSSIARAFMLLAPRSRSMAARLGRGISY